MDREDKIDIFFRIGATIIVVLVVLASMAYFWAKLLDVTNFESAPRHSLYFYDTASQISTNYLIEVSFPEFKSGQYYEVGIYIFPMNANVSTRLINCTLQLEESEHSQTVTKEFVATNQGTRENTYTVMGWLSFSPKDTKHFSEPKIALILQSEGCVQNILLKGG